MFLKTYKTFKIWASSLYLSYRSILYFYLYGRVQKCLTCLNIILPPFSIFILLPWQKYTQDIPKIFPRYSHFLKGGVQRRLTCLHIVLPPFRIVVKNIPKISQDIPIFFREEFRGAWLACTLFFPPLRTRPFYGRLSFPDHFILRTFGNCNL